MARFFDVPFARDGDKTAIPDGLQLDGSVSYEEGFGFDYERPAIDPLTGQPDPLYKPVPRDGTNTLFYEVTDALGVIQRQGFADWTTDAGTYQANAWVRHTGKTWQSIAPTTGEPGVSPDWIEADFLLYYTKLQVDALLAALKSGVPLGQVYFMGQN